MRAGKVSRIVRVLSATLWDFFCMSLPSSSFCSNLEYEVMLTVIFSKKPIRKNSSNVTGTSGSCSSNSIGRISCLWMFLDLFFPFEWREHFFFPCLFLWQKGGDCTWLCFLGLWRVTKVHFYSLLSTLTETSTKRSASAKGPWDLIRTTTGSKLPNWI